MKKLVLVWMAASGAIAAHAQEGSHAVTLRTGKSHTALHHTLKAKSTGVSDTTLYIDNDQFEQAFDSASYSRLDVALPIDSGYIYGMNPLGYKAFAEKFEFVYGASGAATDTTLNILGVLAWFTGHVNTASTKNITFNIWAQGARTAISTKYYHEGLPGSSLKSLSRSIKTLGITNDGLDDPQDYYFTTPLNGVKTNFYLGYEIPYTWGNQGGDTIGSYSTRGGEGINIGYYGLSGTDTIYLDQNVIQQSNGTWFDTYLSLGLVRNLSIAPIVQLSGSKITGVGGVKRNGLTFSAIYPNPANNATTLQFSLAASTDVTVSVFDKAGRLVLEQTHAKLAAGQQEVGLNTAALAAGTYTCALRTAGGDVLAAQLNVVR